MNLNTLLFKQNSRYHLLEKDLYLFWLYYFSESFKYNSPNFHKEWCKWLMTDKHNILIWFRESAKTFWAFIKFVHNIVYKKKRLQMFYSFDKRKSSSRLFDVVIALQTNKKLLYDFWELFNNNIKEDEKQKKTITEFITNNWVKCKASSIWESPRWEVYIAKDWSFRPDAIFADDIDVDKSVSNIDIIEKNYNWFKWELLWWISNDAQIIILWNIIKNDWIIIRLENDYKSNTKWNIYRQAIKDDNWNITWSERFNENDLENKRKMLWEISYNQNYMLIPYSWWDSIIKRHQILYKTYDTWDKIIIWVDPAISEKTLSDNFAIVVTAYIGKYKNIKECIKLNWQEKNIYNACNILKQLYLKYKADIINIETVAFQKVLATVLKQMDIAVNEITPHKDKVSRILEKQSEFEQWLISFDPNWNWINDLIEEVINFPNTIHDDMVDALIYSLYDKKKEFYFL
jgi:predicted phage terminase large subunit-like protein